MSPSYQMSNRPSNRFLMKKTPRQKSSIQEGYQMGLVPEERVAFIQFCYKKVHFEKSQKDRKWIGSWVWFLHLIITPCAARSQGIGMIGVIKNIYEKKKMSNMYVSSYVSKKKKNTCWLLIGFGLTIVIVLFVLLLHLKNSKCSL